MCCCGHYFRILLNSVVLQNSRVSIIMRERKCDITGQRKNSKCMSVSKSHVRTHKIQGVNLQWRKLWWPEENAYVRMRVAARTLRTIERYGLQSTAAKYGCNLRKFIIPGAVPRPIYDPLRKKPVDPAVLHLQKSLMNEEQTLDSDASLGSDGLGLQ
jgi:large subunit ribosomal protein L28